MRRKTSVLSLRGGRKSNGLSSATWQSIQRFPRSLRSFGMTLLMMIMFVAYPTSVFAETATLSLSPSSGTFNQNCPFSVTVNLDTGGVETDGTDAILIYDSSRFLAQSVTNGAIYPDFPGNNIDNSAGKITISGLASVSTPFNGKGVLATVNFMVQSGAPVGAASVNFDFNSGNKALTTDSNVVQRGTVADVLNSVVNGNYVIGTGACDGSKPGPSPVPYQPRGGYQPATPSAVTPAPVYVPPARHTLPDGGTQEFTYTLAIMGGVLTVLGILGIALL